MNRGEAAGRAAQDARVPTDVLVVVARIDGPYPSVGHTGRDGVSRGRKSRAYHQLYRRVLDAAREAIARTGWERLPTSELGLVVATRYCPDRRRLDAWNLGKCEADALTESGVWEDDCVAEPLLRRRYDPAGPDRVVFTIFRGDREAPAEGRVRRRSSARQPSVVPDRGGRCAELNGKPISREAALALIRRK